MAQVIGESGAYREIRRKLAEVGLEIAALEDVARLRDELPRRREAGAAGAAAEYQALAQQYAARLAEWEVHVAATFATELPRFEAAAHAAHDAVDRAEAEKNDVGPFLSNLTRPHRLLRWLRARRGLVAAKAGLRQAIWELERFRGTTELPLRQCRATLDYHATHRPEFIRDRLDRIEGQIALVNQLLEHEVGGAAAEIEMIGLLAALPEGWIVLHDVVLESERWVYQDGRRIKTAQLDHVAVGPGGVFVIETKNWSRAFTEAGEYHSPYDQVSRASDLCHRLLKENGHPSRTRAIIATRTHLPDKPEDVFAKVKRPEEVCGYLTWFKAELAAGEVIAIAALLHGMGQRGHKAG